MLSKIYNKDDNQQIVTAEKASMYVSFPYLGCHSIKIRNRLNKLIKELYPQISLKIAFSPSCTLGSFFKFKDRLEKNLLASIVYKYKCDTCNGSYIGKTKRHFKTRIYEHLGISPRTGKPVLSPSSSKIREHCESCGHGISIENFEMVSSGQSDMDLLILESLYIYKLKPSLNSDLSSIPLICF